MDRKTLTDFFEEVETTEEYNGYFCSIAEAISIVVLGILCGLKNVSQIHQWAESERVTSCKRIFKGEIRNQPHSMLLLAFSAAENGENGHTESMSDEMGCPIFTRRPQSDNHFPGWKNNPFHNRDEAYGQSSAYYQRTGL